MDPFWFESYLSNRTQSVRLNDTVSDKTSISYGVPQGSVLGPILFNIYVNDLASFLPNCDVIQYADDTQIILSSNIDKLKDLIQKAEDTLKLAKIYFNANGLMLNAKKKQCIFIGTRRLLSLIPPNTHLMVDGNVITPSTSVKNLGIYFDNHLSFDTHITELIKKAHGIIMFINRMKDNFNKLTNIIVVQSLVMSIINYGISIWGATNITQVERVQKIQNFAAKVALGGAAKSDHVTPFLRELKWLKINHQYEYEIMTLTYRKINRDLPDWLLPLAYVRDSRSHHVNTRQTELLHVPRCNTCLATRSFQVTAPSLWNNLPPVVQHAPSLFTFKSRLKEFLLNRQFSQ